MEPLYPFCDRIRLHVEGRIEPEDAHRQEKTAREILRRLVEQPGVILADEVGMGKTFVALAVAVSVALQNRGKRPVVVMVPSSLREKWPADFALFREKCLPSDFAKHVKCGRAERAVEFLKLLDDPPSRRKSIVFLTHGAMSRGLNDPWVMLALIRQSVYRRKGIERLRNALSRNVGDLLQLKWVEKRDPDVWRRLLRTHPRDWLSILETIGIEGDDPVPEAVWSVLPQLDTSDVFEAVQEIPLRRSKHYRTRIRNARQIVKDALRTLWKTCLARTRLRLPLLILDEAHHLKNADTRLASLFRSEDAHSDAEELSRGPLAGVFERMLFLTATPFQLGHGELCSVLDRFDGIRWKGQRIPLMGRDGFRKKREHLRSALDKAQEAAVALDSMWGRLRTEELVVDGTSFPDAESWWRAARKGGTLTRTGEEVMECFRCVKGRMAEAEEQLRHWVIRHLKPRCLPPPHSHLPRRRRLVGRSIETDSQAPVETGIPVTGDALLPFLLAARAAFQCPDSRPVFAEGLASSYEAFLHTRQTEGAETTDEDDEDLAEVDVTDEVEWYLDHLEKLIPRRSTADVRHPKVWATVNRAVDIWRRGEKCVVFCHYVATGRILRQKISEALHSEILRMGARKLKLPEDQVPRELERIGRRFFDEDSPLRRSCDAEASRMIAEFPELERYRDDLIEIIRRNVRTPSFLVRYFPLGAGKLDDRALQQAFDSKDASGLTLREILREQFLKFLVDRCGERDRERYIDAVKRIQTGSHFGVDATSSYADDELQGARPENLIPNVRLVNGRTRSETRQRLMLTFNTPFYPEILVASNVMAEGVDLHLNCRYVIHHDLCWNPSTLEQRTGRVDRIGAKAEIARRPIHVYLPFIAETQDEKMYRVVMDRERWFNVVMGEDYKVDVRTTEKLASRIPFPEEAARELAFDLGLR